MTDYQSSKKQTAPPVEKEMSFWDHMEELRWHLVRSAAAIVLMSIIAFLGREIVFDGIILAPNSPDFATNRFFCWIGKALHLGDLCMDTLILKIINLNLSGQFVMHLYISMAAGIVMAAPYVTWEIWRFLRPALKDNERRTARGAVFVISALFFLGVLFGYYLIAPLTINFFGGYHVSELIANQISLTSYISTVVSTTLASGLIFELPVFVYFLTRVGLVSTAFLRRTRKYALLIILTLSAIITPPDVFSQILVGIPLYGLFELSIWVASRTERRSSPAG